MQHFPRQLDDPDSLAGRVGHQHPFLQATRRFSQRSAADARWARSCSAFWATGWGANRSEEHTSELQSLMRISYAVFCLKKKQMIHNITELNTINTLK